MAPLTRKDFLADLAEVHTICAWSRNFIPIVSNGILHACNQRNLPPVTADMSVEDFVLSMEALRLPFHLVQQFSGEFFMSIPIDHGELPEAWSARARALQAVFGRDRDLEVSAYLLAAGLVFRTTDNPICQSLIARSETEEAQEERA